MHVSSFLSVVAGYCELRWLPCQGCHLFLLRAGFLRQQPLRVNLSLSGPQGWQDGINLVGRLPIASNGLSGGHPTTEAELKAASQGGKDSDGSPCGILPAYHTRRQQWSGFFCLPTGAGIRGVRGGVPRLWVLGELDSIRSVFPRPTRQDTVSKHSRHTGVRGGASFGSCLNLHVLRDQISRRFANTQSGGETFRVGPLGVWGSYSRQNQPRGLRRKFVRPALSGVRGGASMGPLGCRRW